MRPKLPPRHAPKPTQKLYEPQTETSDLKIGSDPLSADYWRDETDYGRFGPSVLWHIPTASDVHPRPVTYGRASLPNRNVGGKVGSYNRLGWTKGIAPYHSLRQPFTGGTLRIRGSKAHPVDGPVGKRNHLGMLAEKVGYGFVDLDPTPQEVAAAFTFAPQSVYDEWETG